MFIKIIIIMSLKYFYTFLFLGMLFAFLIILKVSIINNILWTVFFGVIILSTLYVPKERTKVIRLFKINLCFFAVALIAAVVFLINKSFPPSFSWSLLIASFLGLGFSGLIYFAETAPLLNRDEY